MKTTRLSIVFLLALALLFSHSCKSDKSAKDGTEARADKMLAQMTLDEKIGQMSQLNISYFMDPEQLRTAVRDGLSLIHI